MSTAKTIINDSLHTLLGYSDSTLSSFILSIAQSAKSSNDIIRTLKEYDVKPNSGDNMDLTKFANKVYDVVRKERKAASSSSSSSAKKLNNADMIRKGRTEYGLLDGDDDDDDFGIVAPQKQSSSLSSSSSSCLFFSICQ